MKGCRKNKLSFYEFLEYTLYTGLTIRRLQKWWPNKNASQTEANLLWWIGILSALFSMSINVWLFSSLESLLQNRMERYITFVVPFLFVFAPYYYLFFWNDQWMSVVNKFDNKVSRRKKKVYGIILSFLVVILVTSIMYKF